MSKWIDKYKEMPPYGVAVLIVMRNGFITTAYRKTTGPNEDTWYVYHDNLSKSDVEITHWMPLPNPPNTTTP